MAEKAFKVPSLGLVGTTAELDFASGDLRWNALPLATESYVDSAVANVTVNTTVLAGNGLVANGAALDINPGAALYLSSDILNVNVAELAGNGLKANGNTLEVNTARGVYLANDSVFVNVNALAGGGLYAEFFNDYVQTIRVNTQTLAGSGLTFDANALAINAGVGLLVNAVTDTVGVNTDIIATRAYVDSVAEGLHIHESVVAATTTNVALATALENGDVLDGITLATGNRILVKNQTTQSENGIYVVQASGQPTRAADFDTATEVDSGDFVFVYSGTANAGTGWVQTNRPATIGTDAIVFTQFSGAGTYIAGDGLALTGNQFDVKVGSGLFINATADTVQVNTATIAGNGLTSNGTQLSINPGTALYLSSDYIEVNTTVLAGNGLVANGAALDINPGAALYLSSDILNVNVAELAGNGIKANGNTLEVNTARGVYLANDSVFVNVNAVAGGGLYAEYFNDYVQTIRVNTQTLAGNGLTFDANALAINAGTGLFVNSVADTVNVNTNVIATSLVGTGLYVTSGDNLTVNANSVAASVAPVLGTISGGYGAFWEFYIEGANSTNRTTMTTGGISDWTSSDTYTVAHSIALSDYFVRSTQTSAGQIDADNVGAFEAEVVITLIDGNAVTKKRVSKIMGTYSGSTVDYTEFAIVEHGGSIPGVDVLLEYGVNSVDVKVKATIDFNNAETLYATVNARTFGNHSFAL